MYALTHFILTASLLKHKVLYEALLMLWYDAHANPDHAGKLTPSGTILNQWKDDEKMYLFVSFQVDSFEGYSVCSSEKFLECCCYSTY